MSGSTDAVSASHGKASDAISAEHCSGAGIAWLPQDEGRAVPVPSDWPQCSFLELAALPTVVPCGRLHTRQVLWEWKLDHLADDAETLVSELLTNAVRASWSPAGPGLVALRLLANHERLVIEVWDQNPDHPQPRQADHQSESGRGFVVIEALSHRWGFRRVSPSFKVVWCELAAGCD
jgi:anti-sigma regulatory factor (Ser/Thr protein kinase)